MKTIDVTRDKLIPLAEAAASLPNRPCTTALWRWWAKGVRVVTPLPDGGEHVHRVKLETVRVGRWRYTTLEAFRRFVAQTNPDAAVNPQAETDRNANVDERLQREGLLDSPRKNTFRQLAG